MRAIGTEQVAGIVLGNTAKTITQSKILRLAAIVARSLFVEQG
jgi:hypothetical protein